MSEPTRDHPQFEPEVEALLREIAKDPRSCLLRLPRPAVSNVVLESRSYVLAGATGLTAAERQLLLVHRADAASLLRDLCRRRLLDASFLAGALAPDWSSTRGPERLRSEAEWDRDARAELEFAAEGGADVDGHRFLQACVGRRPDTRTSIADLSAASLRLEPTDEARIYIALDQIADGALGSAEAALHRVIQGTSRRHIASIAWENLGLARWCVNDAERALDMYERSASIDPTRCMPMTGAFVTAIMLGRLESARRWSRLLDDGVAPDNGVVERACRTLAGRRIGSEQLSRRNAREVMRRAGDGMGPTSRRIIDVLT